MKPQRFYGLHMVEGVAQYQEPGKDPYRILIREETIKNMDATFTGLPVFVHHVENVDFSDPKLKDKADGFVVRSFFNKADGKHWAEFIVVSERGMEAIRNNWKLSNSYFPKQMREGGLWHAVDYSKEVTEGEYEHLALVPNPRYDESIILTPEEFKAYNANKEAELMRIANSKETKQEKKSMLSFFKKTKVENGADLEGMSVTLPKSGKEMAITELVAEMDKVINMHGYANEEHMVKVGNDEMMVKDLVKKHQDMCNEMEEMKKKNVATDEEVKEKAKDIEKHEEKEIEEKKKNEEEKPEEKKENEEEKKEEKEKHMNALLEAEKNARKSNGKTIMLSMDQVALGKTRYGSN